MTVVCTSCGLSIPPSMNFYKCRQCAHHYVCQVCETKHYNRTSSSSHTLDRISVPQVQTTTVVDANIQSVPTYDARQHHPPKVSFIIIIINRIFFILLIFIINFSHLQNHPQYLIVTAIFMVYLVVVHIVIV